MRGVSHEGPFKNGHLKYLLGRSDLWTGKGLLGEEDCHRYPVGKLVYFLIRFTKADNEVMGAALSKN